MTHPLWKRAAAEFTGTAILVGLGTGAIVAGANAGGIPQWELAVAWFLAVLVPVLLFAFVSGAHLNPAVTLALVASRRFPGREVAPYVVAQVVGAIFASVVVGQSIGRGANLGATTPHGIGVVEVFGLEFAFTASIVLVVLYLTRPRLDRPGWELVLPAVVVGVSTELIGPLTGSSLNPARSIGPALLSGVYTGLAAYVLAALTAVAFAALVVWAWTRAFKRGTPPQREAP